MIAVLYELATGRAVSIGSTAPDTLPPHLAAYVLDVPYATMGGYEWDADTATLVPRGAAATPIMSVLTFVSRLSLEEQVAVEMAQDSHPSAQTRATLKVLQRHLDRATQIDITDPRTVQGAGVTVDVLVGLGLVAPADRDARLAALLAPEPVGE